MMIKRKIYKDLPIEIGKTYKLKFQTLEHFEVLDIVNNSKGEPIMVKGYYIEHKNVGICPLNIDRLINETIFDREIECCEHCGR